MPFRDRPGDYLAFVGPDHAREGHRATRSSSAARRGSGSRSRPRSTSSPSTRHFREVVQPAIDDGAIDFLGEVGPEERDPLYAGALATVMLGGWPEPFGLVAIESMATGTPVIARRAGALIETVIHGENGLHRRRRGRGRARGRAGRRAGPHEDPGATRSSGSRRRGWPTSTRRPTARSSPTPGRAGRAAERPRSGSRRWRGRRARRTPDHTGVDDASDEHRSPALREPLTRG